MQQITTSLLGFLVLAGMPLHGAEFFEGQYDMSFSGKGQPVSISFWAKGGNLRMEVQGKKGQTGEMILRDDMSSMLMIMPQQHMYMEMPIPQDMIEAKSPTGGKDSEIPMKKTGKSREILGYTAYEYVSEKDGEMNTIWATDELGSMPFARSPMLKGWADAMRQMTGLDAFFPLEATGTRNGKDTYHMAVTMVDKKSLPDSMFQPPEGFRKITMPAGMGGMMQGQGR